MAPEPKKSRRNQERGRLVRNSRERAKAKTDRSRAGRAKEAAAKHAEAVYLITNWVPFLSDAGFSPSVANDYLWIGESAVLKVDGEDYVYKTAAGTRRITATKPGADRAIRTILMAAAGHRLEERVAHAVHLNSSIRATLGPLGVDLMVGDVHLGIVSPWEATISNTRPIRANFFTDGPHWQALSAACELQAPLVAEAAARRRPPKSTHRALPTFTPVRITKAPAALPRDLIMECMEASEDIRLRRNTVVGHPAKLRSHGCALEIDPIRRINGSLAVAFVYADALGEVEGVLTIEGSHVPLPVSIYERMLTPTGVNAWVACLLGFRALSIPDFALADSERERPSRSGRERLADVPRTRRAPRLEAPLSERPWSDSLHLRRGGAHAPHWVVGHKRVLAFGQEASTQKRSEAAEYGIFLQAGETWVSPHARGASPDYVMQFRWVAPEAFERRVAGLTGATG